MWKKKIAVLMAAAMITGMSGMTVFAEEETGNISQMEQQVQQAPTGMEGEAPQMEGQAPQGEAPADMEGQAPQGEVPQLPQGEAPAGQPPQMGQQPPQMREQAPQGEAPQAPADMEQQPSQGEAPADMGQQPSQGEAQQAPQDEAPSANGQQAPQVEGLFEEGQSFQNSTPMGSGNRQAPGKMDHRNPFIDFEACVKDGTISQETYDAIKKYMDENKPERPTDGGEEGTDTEVKEGERPEDGTNTEMKEDVGSEMEKPDLLKDLLDAEVITQDEYDALAKRTADEKVAGAQEEKAAEESA